MPDQDYADLGALAAALAKAQASFPAITRDKEVTVTSDKGSYKFKYAPLDKIIEAVRGPLAANGLAFTQLLDSDPDGLPFLVSRLLHASGASIEGRTPIPFPEGAKVQAFGSAITYVRRYALQAMLGIAAEEDDDGNAASGNRADFGGRQPPALETAQDGSIIGIAELGKGASDFELRQTPDGNALSFRLVSGRKSIQVTALDPLASALALVKAEVLDQRVQVWGRVADETFTPKGTSKKIPYQVLFLSRIQAPTFTLPATEARPPSAAGTTTNGTPTDRAGRTSEEAPETPASSPSSIQMPQGVIILPGDVTEREAREVRARWENKEIADLTDGAEIVLPSGKKAIFHRVAGAAFTTPVEEASAIAETAEASPSVPDDGGAGAEEVAMSAASVALCSQKGPASIPGGAICTLAKGHEGRHREQATDGHTVAAW